MAKTSSAKHSQSSKSLRLVWFQQAQPSLGFAQRRSAVKFEFDSDLLSIDTFIFKIGHNLAKIWVHACKNIMCMYSSLCPWVMFFAQICLAYLPDSKITLISLIQPNLAEIWDWHASTSCACTLDSVVGVNYVLRKDLHVIQIP